MKPELIVRTDPAVYASQVRAFAESQEGENALFLGGPALAMAAFARSTAHGISGSGIE